MIQTAAGAGLILHQPATVSDGCAPFFIQCAIRSWFRRTAAGLATGL